MNDTPSLAVKHGLTMKSLSFKQASGEDFLDTLNEWVNHPDVEKVSIVIKYRDGSSITKPIKAMEESE